MLHRSAGRRRPTPEPPARDAWAAHAWAALSLRQPLNRLLVASNRHLPSCAARLGAILLLAVSCDRAPSAPAQGAAGPAAAQAVVQEGKALLDQGQLDAALARLLQAPEEPVSLYYQGLVHVRKGLASPLPDRGFRDEDRLAVAALERAVAAKPEFAAAHFTLAEVLAPYALRPKARPAGRLRGAPASPAPADPEATPERVVQEYQAAIREDKTSRAPIDALIRFARASKRPEAAEPAYLEWLAREKESAAPHVAFADHLLAERKQPLRAIEQYELALIWKPDDAETKAKVCGIYLDMAQEHLAKREWAVADARLKDAQKFLTSGAAQQAQRAAELSAKLKAIRR